MAKHYKNEVGTSLYFDTGVDLTSMTKFYVRWRKPDGTTIGSWAACGYSSYSQLASATGSYFVTYTLTQVAGTYDIDQPGIWKFQVEVANTTGTWYGETVEENIYDQLQ